MVMQIATASATAPMTSLRTICLVVYMGSAPLAV